MAHARHHVAGLLTDLSMAFDAGRFRRALSALLGTEVFAFGFVMGMSHGVSSNAHEVLRLYRTFALADYYTSQHGEGFWDRFRHRFSVFAPETPLVATDVLLSPSHWRLIDFEAQEAFYDRTAFLEAVRYAVHHPQEVFGTLAQALDERHQAFVEATRRRSLTGNLQAGIQFGELLVDVILAIDSGAGLPKLIQAVPRLAKTMPNFARLVRIIQTPAEATGGAARTAAAAFPPAGPKYDLLNLPGAVKSLAKTPDSSHGIAKSAVSRAEPTKLGNVEASAADSTPGAAAARAVDGQWVGGLQPRSNVEVYGAAVTRTEADIPSIMSRVGITEDDLAGYQFRVLTPEQYSARAATMGADFDASYGPTRISSGSQYRFMGDIASTTVKGEVRIPIYLNPDIMGSDEAIVQAVSHEWSEVEALRYEAAQPISGTAYRNLVSPYTGMSTPNLHFQAVNFGDQMLSQFRSLLPGG